MSVATKDETRIRPDVVSTGTAVSWGDLGLARYLGSTITAFPPADCASEWDVVGLVLAEDPRIRPLWTTKCWQQTTGGLVKRTYLMIAFEAASWNRDHPALAGVILPVHQPRLRYRGPFRCPSVLDGLEDLARARGIPEESVESTAERWRSEGAHGCYVQLAAVYPEIKYRTWEVRHRVQYGDEWAKLKQQSLGYFSARDDADRKATKALKEQILENRRDDRRQLQREAGTGDSVFVSSTLQRLREVAGVSPAA